MNNHDIAICIPSLNESNSIEKTTGTIAEGLQKYFSNYESIIINADNSSTDGTQDKFLSTETGGVNKISLTTKKKGKGENIIIFMKYALKNQIPYLAMFDADLKSIKPSWVKKMLDPILSNSADYVVPIYKRNRYEGNTTNHICYPIIYTLWGLPIRQPIAGDFAFNLKYIKKFLQVEESSSNYKYGIDIAMTLTAVMNNYAINQVKLDKKIHNPSFGKMVPMFREVSCSLITMINRYYKFDQDNLNKNIHIPKAVSTIKQNTPIDNESIIKRTNEAIELINTQFNKGDPKLKEQLLFARKCLENNLYYTYKDFNAVIIKLLNSITNGELLTQMDCNGYSESLLCCYLARVLSYLREVESMMPSDVDDLLNKQAIMLRKEFQDSLVF